MYHLWNVTDDVIIASSSDLCKLMNHMARLVSKKIGTLDDYNIYPAGEGPLPWEHYYN